MIDYVNMLLSDIHNLTPRQLQAIKIAISSGEWTDAQLTRLHERLYSIGILILNKKKGANIL
jgi:hypothetical protein